MGVVGRPMTQMPPMPYAGYLPESAVPGRQPMTDTHPFDPALFRDAAIDADTAHLNAQMIEC